MFFLYAKCIHPISASPLPPTYFNPLASTLSKTSSTYHLNQVWVTLGTIHPGSKYLFFCEPVKLDNKLSASKIQWWGFPWWHSGWESACQCRGHGFEPWSGRIPHATEQLGPWATTTEPARLEPVPRNKRGRNSERPAHGDEEWPPLAATGERKPSHRDEDPTQPKINKSINKSIKIKKKIQWWERGVKHSHSKRERLKGRKGSWVPSKSKT